MNMPTHHGPHRKPIRVLVAGDSTIAQRLLRKLLHRHEGIQVVGMVHNGMDVVKMTKHVRPDVVLMDIAMPLTNGETVTRHIVGELHIPVVGVTSLDVSQVAPRLQAAGASAVLSKSMLFQEQGIALVEALRQAASGARPLAVMTPARDSRPRVPFPVVAVAASTSGPQALRQLLSSLPADFAAAVVVAQHLSDGFVAGLVEWLQNHVALVVQVAEEGMALTPGHVYLAPDGHHITVHGERLAVPRAENKEPWRPSANALFRSVATWCGPLGIAVVLTGMGRDGAEGAAAVHQAGGRVIVQDPVDAAVMGMPRATIEQGTYDVVLPLRAIGPYLTTLVKRMQQAGDDGRVERWKRHAN